MPIGAVPMRLSALRQCACGVEGDRLVAAERQLAQSERELVDLELADAEAKSMLGTLRDLANVWGLMTPDNRGRLLRALVVAVRVNEATGVVEVELVNVGAAARTWSAA